MIMKRTQIISIINFVHIEYFYWSLRKFEGKLLPSMGRKLNNGITHEFMGQKVAHRTLILAPPHKSNWKYSKKYFF